MARRRGGLPNPFAGWQKTRRARQSGAWANHTLWHGRESWFQLRARPRVDDDGPGNAATRNSQISAAAAWRREGRRAGGVRSRSAAPARPAARDDRRRQGGQLLERRDPSGERGRTVCGREQEPWTSVDAQSVHFEPDGLSRAQERRLEFVSDAWRRTAHLHLVSEQAHSRRSSRLCRRPGCPSRCHCSISLAWLPRRQRLASELDA